MTPADQPRRRMILVMVLLGALIVSPLLLQVHEVLEWDARLFLEVNSHYRRGDLDLLLWGITQLGSLELMIIIDAALFALGRRKWGFALLAIMLGITAIGLGVRLFVDRPRPYIAYPEIHHLQFVLTTSFPSGHALVASSMLGLLWARGSRLALPMAAVLAIVALSRVYLGVHYPLDVLFGSLMGLSLGLLVGGIDILPAPEGDAVDSEEG